MDLHIPDGGDVHKAIPPVLLYVTECVLSCQREVEDDMDSYQVSTQHYYCVLHCWIKCRHDGHLLYSRDPRQWHDLRVWGVTWIDSLLLFYKPPMSPPKT